LTFAALSTFMATTSASSRLAASPEDLYWILVVPGCCRHRHRPTDRDGVITCVFFEPMI
jgi:hypothetical protein